MTGEDGARPFLFVETIEPLPLVDPSIAAQFLDVRRHTLACYRNLGDGPAYYKFGRWVRYAEADLRAWNEASGRNEAVSDAFDLFAAHRGAPDLLDSVAAARFLTVTRHCLSNYRKTGHGPRLRRFGRRIYYAVDELVEWAEKLRMPASARSRRSDMILQRP